MLKRNNTTVKTEITAGICIGIISHVVINLACKKWRDISPLCTFSRFSSCGSTYSSNTTQNNKRTAWPSFFVAKICTVIKGPIAK